MIKFIRRLYIDGLDESSYFELYSNGRLILYKKEKDTYYKSELVLLTFDEIKDILLLDKDKRWEKCLDLFEKRQKQPLASFASLTQVQESELEKLFDDEIQKLNNVNNR